MNQISNIFEGEQVRIVGTEEKPLFVLSDVCKVLEIGNPSDVKRRLEDDVYSIEVISDAIGRKRNTVVISEDGLYEVILDSRKPQAKRFRKWITSEIIPSIRKEGRYMIAQPNESPEEIMARSLLIAQSTIERLQQGKEKTKLELYQGD